MRIGIGVGLASSLLALVGPACKKGPSFGAGFEGTIVLRTTRGSEPPVDLVVKTKGDHLRFETTARDGTTTAAIYVPDKQRLVLVFDSSKTTMDLDMSSPRSPAPNTTPLVSVVKKTGKTETIAGTSCDDYDVRDPTGRRTETCIAEGIAYFDIASLRSPTGGTTWSRMMHEKKLFPLRSVDYDASNTETSRTEAISIESGSLDDSIFVVPSGYARVGRPVY